MNKTIQKIILKVNFLFTIYNNYHLTTLFSQFNNKLLTYIIINNQQYTIMNEQNSFSKGITQYISMALHIWPALQLSLPHLHQATNPPAGSPIPHRKYSDMKPQQFMQTIIQDFHNYILQHDVKSDHIIDYLDDILAILSAEQQNTKTKTHMAEQLVLLIQELPEGNNSRLINFRFVYNALKGQNVGHVVKVQDQQGNQENQDVHHGSEDQCDESDDQMQEQCDQNQNEQQKMEAEQPPKLVQQGQENQQDDGWVVVKKKSKK